MSNLYKGHSKDASKPSFDSFGQAVSEEKIFQKSTNQKQELSVAAMSVNRLELNEESLQRTCQRCFLPSFDSFGQAVSEEKIFQKSTNQKQELPMVAMFVNGSGQNEQSFQRGPSIDASYQVSLHLAEGFQRRRLKCEKVTDDRQRTPSHGKSSRCLWQGELKIYCSPRWFCSLEV